MMIWRDWTEFFHMGGYALYVWGSVMAVIAVIVGEVAELAWRGRAIRSELAHDARVDPGRAP